MNIETRHSPDTAIPIVNGKLIRPGFYRLNTNTTAAQYTHRAATGELDRRCVFCPPLQQQHLLEGTPDGFSAFTASAPYQYWDGREVKEHWMITPDEHVTSLGALGSRAVRQLYDFLGDLRHTKASEGVTLQDYTRIGTSPSKSVSHVHTHAFSLSDNRVDTLEYTIEKGLTELSFRPIRPGEPHEPELHWDAQELVGIRTIKLPRVYLGHAALMLHVLAIAEKEQLESEGSLFVQPYIRVNSKGQPTEAMIFSMTAHPVASIRIAGGETSIKIATLTPQQCDELRVSRAARDTSREKSPAEVSKGSFS